MEYRSCMPELNNFRKKKYGELTLFLIFRRIFFNDFSSVLVNGSLVGIG